MERQWKLGEDLHTQDNLLDGVTFDELILAVRCNCRKITETSVLHEMNAIIETRTQDMSYLLRNNLHEIMRLAERGRS